MFSKVGRMVAVTLVAAALLAACGKPISNSGAVKGPTVSNEPKVLTIAQGTDVEAWSPYAHSTTTTYGIWSNILEPLVKWDFEKKEFVGVLAESWSVAADKTTWTIKLRKGVKFHDGTDFTAKDVIHSYTRIQKDKDSKQASNLRQIKEMKVIDDNTLLVVTTQPDATFLHKLNNRHITSEANFKKYPTAEEADKHPIGTGPYKFVEWERGSRFVLEKNKDYRGGAPAYDKVIYKAIPDASTRITALESGQVDIINNVPPHEVKRLADNKQLKVVSSDSLRSIFMPLNPTFKPLDNKLVRQAIMHAVDIDSIVKNVLEGQATRLTTGVAPIIFGYDPNHKPFTFDPEKSKQLLAQAGFPDGFAIDLMSPNGRYSKDLEVSQAVASMLGKVGIKVTVKTPEWGIFTNDLDAGKLPFYLIGRGGAVDGNEIISQYWETGVTKRSLFSTPELDASLKADRLIFDSSRLPVLQKSVNMAYDEAAAIFLLVYKDNYGVRATVDWKATPDEYIVGADAKPKQ